MGDTERAQEVLLPIIVPSADLESEEYNLGFSVFFLFFDMWLETFFFSVNSLCTLAFLLLRY